VARPHVERDAVLAEFERGQMEETLRYRSQQLTVELKGLKRSIEQLSSAARELLLTEDELAAEYEGHPPRASALQVLEDRADEQLSWLTIDREQGRPRELARQGAVAQLEAIWLAHSGDPAPGRLTADKIDIAFQPNEFIRFLGDCFLHLQPGVLRDHEVACRAAHSALRALLALRKVDLR
jgi:hypothetical protein